MSDWASQPFGANELRVLAEGLAAAATAHNDNGDGQAAIDLTVASGIVETVISRLAEQSRR